MTYRRVCAGSSIVIRFGRIKTDGQVQHQTLDSAEDAIAHARKIVAEKLRKGYKVAQVPKNFFQGFAIGDPDGANGADDDHDDAQEAEADHNDDGDAEGNGVSASFEGFGGMTFVLAGIVGDERRDLIALIKQHGGSVAAAPSFKTTHLILGPGAYGLDVHANALTKGAARWTRQFPLSMPCQ